MITIREFTDSDWPGVWHCMEPVIRSGESYPYAQDMNADGARHMWIDKTAQAYVALNAEGEVVGSYYLAPNQPTLGAHVANAGYVVGENARGLGVGAALCEHSEAEAVRQGFRALQFNLVVSTNEPSVRLWDKMGFTRVGVLPGAFKHAQLGYVDAIVFYKTLVTE